MLTDLFCDFQILRHVIVSPECYKCIVDGQTYLVKDQTVNILSFLGHIVSPNSLLQCKSTQAISK